MTAVDRVSIICDHSSHKRPQALKTLIRQPSGGWDEAPDVAHRLKMARGNAPGERTLPAPAWSIREHNGERYLLWSFVCHQNERHNQEFRKAKLDPALDAFADAGVREVALRQVAAMIQKLARVRPGA